MTKLVYKNKGEVKERKTPAWRESTPSILKCPACAQVSVVKVVGGDASYHCFGCGTRWPTEEAYLADFGLAKWRAAGSWC